MKALDIAKWFIRNGYDNPRNTWDGNMKLQKLLYFAQLIHLANYGDPLFDNPIFAYKNGSVVEEVRVTYRDNHELLIKQANEFEGDFTEEQLNTLKITAEIFGKIEPTELSELNHLHQSWKEAYQKSDTGFGYRRKELSEISVESLKKYDLDKISEILAAHQSAGQSGQKYEIVNGVKFYYNPGEITLTDEIIEQLEAFQGDEKSYSIYLDKNIGLVIY
jgi:uncharacterized phage-associated protein